MPIKPPTQIVSHLNTKAPTKDQIQERIQSADEPWLQIKGESDAQYQAFAAYRDLGMYRSLQAVASALNKDDGEISVWARRFEWIFRTELWDRRNMRIAADKAAKEHQEMRERHINISMVMQDKAVRALASLDPSELNPVDMVRLVREAVRIERLSRDVPTEIISTQHRQEARETVHSDAQFTIGVLQVLNNAGALPVGVDIGRLEEIAKIASQDTNPEIIEAESVEVQYDDDIPEASE
jgi:hypothetical protein